MTQSGSLTGPIVNSGWGLFEWLLVIGPVLVLVLIIAYVLRKGAPMAGENVFRASRLSRGNRLFPSQVVISPSSITLFKPQWIGKVEESIHMAHVSSIKIDTNLLFANVYIETSGGHSPIVCYGHTKGDVVTMKKLVEKFQSDYYRTRTGQPVNG
jgi:hypothetical protein